MVMTKQADTTKIVSALGLLGGNHNVITVDGNMNTRNGMLEGINDFLADGIFLAALNGAAQIPGTIGDGIGFLNKKVTDYIVPGQR